jgi:hypothetical protein
VSVLGERMRRAVRRVVERTVEPLLVRKVCPTCHERELEPDPDVVPCLEGYVAGYRCRCCAGQWRRLDAGPLIPLSAWDAGVRDDGSLTPLSRSLWRAATRARERATQLVEPLLARKVCPACHARMLEPDPEQASEQAGGSHVAGYRCRGCSAQWRSLDGGALIARADWDDGVRGSDVPTATARTRLR